MSAESEYSPKCGTTNTFCRRGRRNKQEIVMTLRSFGVTNLDIINFLQTNSAELLAKNKPGL